MSAARHAHDANAEALRLHIAIQALCERNLLGENITPQEIADLLPKSACVQYHTARTQYAVSQFEARREAELKRLLPEAMGALA